MADIDTCHWEMASVFACSGRSGLAPRRSKRRHPSPEEGACQTLAFGHSSVHLLSTCSLAKPAGTGTLVAGLRGRRAEAVRALFTALGLHGGGVALVAAAAQWLAAAVQVHGGHMPRALAAIWAVVARGSLYITTSTGALTIWAPPHDLFHLHPLGFEAGLENTAGIRACLFELVALGARNAIMQMF